MLIHSRSTIATSFPPKNFSLAAESLNSFGEESRRKARKPAFLFVPCANISHCSCHSLGDIRLPVLNSSERAKAAQNFLDQYFQLSNGSLTLITLLSSLA